MICETNIVFNHLLVHQNNFGLLDALHCLNTNPKIIGSKYEFNFVIRERMPYLTNYSSPLNFDALYFLLEQALSHALRGSAHDNEHNLIIGGKYIKNLSLARAIVVANLKGSPFIHESELKFGKCRPNSFREGEVVRLWLAHTSGLPVAQVYYPSGCLHVRYLFRQNRHELVQRHALADFGRDAPDGDHSVVGQVYRRLWCHS